MISSLIRAFNAFAFAIAFVKRVSPLPGYKITCVAYGNGKFVGLAYNGTTHKVITSTDGITWTAGATISIFLSINTVTGIVFGNGIFVAYQAIPDGSSAITVASSVDGTTWTKRTTVFTSSVYDNIVSCSFLNGIFILVGNTGSTYIPRIVTSTDGITWTSRTTGLAAADEILGVAYSANLFIVTATVSADGSKILLKSTNGTTWTKMTFPYQSDGYLYGIYFINNTFVIITSTYKVFTSSDGINWTKSSTNFPSSFPRLLSVNNLLYLNVYKNTVRTIYVSTNGIDWSILPTSFTTQRIDAITYGNGLYVSTSNDEIATSTSGIS